MAAQQGDHRAYQRLIEPHSRDLHVHCYRMLGSLHDAEDAMQDALLRAWRALPRFGGPKLVRPWLFRIATNTCLDLLARRPGGARSPEAALRVPDNNDDRQLSSVSMVQPYPDATLEVEDGHATPDAVYEQREAVELAFIAALQHLRPRQRAALILREVLGFSAREVADALDTSVASVNSALQRARKTLAERLPERSQQTTLRSLGDERVRALGQRFADAWDAGDIQTLIAALTDDITFTMPPQPTRRGPEAIEAFLPVPGSGSRWRLIPTGANAQLAFGAYRWDPVTRMYEAAVLDVVSFRDARIAEVVAFSVPELFGLFELPAHIR
jgi:RNA polymerase sigma-70 factor (ECF subfamily)